MILLLMMMTLTTMLMCLSMFRWCLLQMLRWARCYQCPMACMPITSHRLVCSILQHSGPWKVRGKSRNSKRKILRSRKVFFVLLVLSIWPWEKSWKIWNFIVKCVLLAFLFVWVCTMFSWRIFNFGTVSTCPPHPPL